MRDGSGVEVRVSSAAPLRPVPASTTFGREGVIDADHRGAEGAQRALVWVGPDAVRRALPFDRHGRVLWATTLPSSAFNVCIPRGARLSRDGETIVIQSEGDPIVKSRLRSLARDRARKRMMAAVPRATLIIANPTHFSIALKYVRDEDSAPLVVAKGQDLVALKIREIAKEHNIPIYLVRWPDLSASFVQAEGEAHLLDILDQVGNPDEIARKQQSVGGDASAGQAVNKSTAVPDIQPPHGGLRATARYRR